MKTLSCLFTVLAITTSLGAAPGNPQMRPDIAEDIPLAEAVRQANTQFPDVQPLTAAEVIAAVKRIKQEHPDISEAIHRIYMRIAEEGVLPRGVYFSRIPVLVTDTEHFDVDWKDLTLTALPPGSKDPEIGYGFNHRVRARFISSRPLTEQEKARYKNLTALTEQETARQKNLTEKVEPAGPVQKEP